MLVPYVWTGTRVPYVMLLFAVFYRFFVFFEKGGEWAPQPFTVTGLRSLTYCVLWRHAVADPMRSHGTSWHAILFL